MSKRPKLKNSAKSGNIHDLFVKAVFAHVVLVSFKKLNQSRAR